MANDSAGDLLKCLVCSTKLNSKNKATPPPSKVLIDLICSMFDSTNVSNDSEESKNLCKECHKRFSEVYELQSKLAQAKSNILNNLKANSTKSECEITDDESQVFVGSIEEVETFKIEAKEEIIIKEAESELELDPEPESEYYAIEIPAQEEIEIHQEETETLPEVKAKKNVVKKNKSIKKAVVSKTELLQDPVVSRSGDLYTCLLCPENLFAGIAKDIITHMKESHYSRLYICDVCGQDFTKRNELSNHLDEHVATEQGDFQCDVCSRIFENLRLYRIHKRIHNPQVKSWTCDICEKAFSSKNLLQEHMNVHTGVRPYVCAQCGKDFASKYTFRAHSRTHEARARPFECKQCDKSFLSQQNLNQHVKTHNGVKEFICETCGKAFASQHNLDVHNIVHTGYKPFICKSCGKAFARKAEIRDHERTHTGEKPYQCEFCGSTFSQRSNLQSHKRATHFNDKRYKCDDCGKGFKRRRLLDYHIKAAHTGERPYKCETCSATFVYPEHFKKHLRIHTGEKPYLCEVCGKAFNSRDNRNAHRFIHSDKKPYECLVCGMGFMRKPLLYAHMQTQGHINDTIVVNQPRLTTEDEIFIQEGNQIQLVMQSDSEQYEEGNIRIIELKDHVIIEDDANQKYKIASSEETTETVMEEEESAEGDNANEESNFKEEEEIESSQFEESNAIVIPEGTDYEDIMGSVKNGNIRLLQIHIPQSEDEVEDDTKNWIKLLKKQ